MNTEQNTTKKVMKKIMKKIMIIGSPGAGKSFLATQLTVLTGIKLFHLDQIYWHEDKSHISHEELVEQLQDIFQKDSYIIDGNYNRTLEMRMEDADTILFLDYPVEDCICGVEERVGQERQDIPWKEETPDPEFLTFVKDFPTQSRPKICEYLSRYENKNIVILHNREEVKAFVASFFPERVRKIADDEGYEIITKDHGSGDLVYGVSNRYILKVSCKEKRLFREYEVNEFLKDKLPVSENVVYEMREGVEFYMKTSVPGTPLSYKEYLQNPELLIDLLVKAMKMVHEVDIHHCSIVNYDSDMASPEATSFCMIHGDFCLPNILATGDRVTGIIDTEAGGIGDPWVDYAWCIWSLEFNLQTKEYTPLLLDKLGIEMDYDRFEQYTGSKYIV